MVYHSYTKLHIEYIERHYRPKIISADISENIDISISILSIISIDMRSVLSSTNFVSMIVQHGVSVHDSIAPARHPVLILKHNL